jgi:hypothetical protein
MPMFVRKFVVDAVEGFVAFTLTLALVIPGSLDDAKAQASIVAVGLIGAIIAGARRNAPAALAWFRERLGVPAG